MPLIDFLFGYVLGFLSSLILILAGGCAYLIFRRFGANVEDYDLSNDIFPKVCPEKYNIHTPKEQHINMDDFIESEGSYGTYI